MKKKTRIALLALLLAGGSFAAQEANVEAAASPSQDPLVQHLKLNNDQVKKIEDLHQKLEDNVSKIPMTGVKDGALVDMFQAGEWDESVVKNQLAAFSKVEEQARYYRVKYYFDLNKVLTPEQRLQVQKDIAQTLSE